jgi:two-component system sensor histidine kinase VicK
VTFANARLSGLLGVDPVAVDGQPAREALAQPEALRFLERCAANPAHAARGDGVEFHPSADPTRSVAARAYPLFSPRDPQSALGLLVVFRDVTAEALGRQAGAEFVSHVSHELKSPLNVLKMYSELLLEDGGESRERRIESVNVIRDEVERMADLIGNLLSASKIEQGSVALDRQRVRLGDLLQDLATRAARSAEAKGVELKLVLAPELSPLMLDKDLTRIAIGNLLSNAIKYNRAGGSVVLSAEEGDTHVAIRVRDTGIGIERADIGRVFEKFYRSAGATAAATGHGLGLYLTRQIVELQQGSLSVTSEPGQGSEFTLLLAKHGVLAGESARI